MINSRVTKTFSAKKSSINFTEVSLKKIRTIISDYSSDSDCDIESDLDKLKNLFASEKFKREKSLTKFCKKGDQVSDSISQKKSRSHI